MVANTAAMFPSAILFDLDDTLFDHRHASTEALRVLHAAYASSVDFVNFTARHGALLEEYYGHFLVGRYTLDQARAARMRALFDEFDPRLPDEACLTAAHLYREHHQANRRLVPGARALLDAAAARARLGIVTNNSTAEQIEKLAKLDIARYFDTIVISEDVGVAKPDPRIFEIALERIGFPASECVHVGDSWTSDVRGAQAAGIACVWLDREDQASARLSSHFCLEGRASAGVSRLMPEVVQSLSPADAMLAAIQKTFLNQKLSGAMQHDCMETLAT